MKYFTIETKIHLNFVHTIERREKENSSMRLFLKSHSGKYRLIHFFEIEECVCVCIILFVKFSIRLMGLIVRKKLKKKKERRDFKCHMRQIYTNI